MSRQVIELLICNVTVLKSGSGEYYQGANVGDLTEICLTIINLLMLLLVNKLMDGILMPAEAYLPEM